MIDGVMRLWNGSTVNLRSILSDNSSIHTIKVEPAPFECFYAYPSKSKIEQVYLPALIDVFKGCRDLALLVASYLEWSNDTS